jgi:hypothetical protein
MQASWFYDRRFLRLQTAFSLQRSKIEAIIGDSAGQGSVLAYR